jgi:Phytanoyl-CoA dioxygenase (PhyH)
LTESAAVPAVREPSRSALDADGYIVVPTGLPPSILEAVVDDIWRHAGATPDDPATWYQPAVIRPRPGMVEMYHYQSMWDVRQHPAVYGIFRGLHRTDELWVSIDRVALKPPVRPDQPDYDQPGFIHWDTDINMYPDIPFRLQGVLALEDTSADMGGFQCVPSVYRDQQRFLDERSKAGPVSRAPDIGDHPVVKVPLAAGDLVIWKTALLHGNGKNSSQRPRLAQYLAMNPLPPAGEQRETVRRSRIMSWSACAPPDEDAFPGDPRRIEEQRGEPASLGPLGRRLLGLDEWAHAPGTP